MTRPLKLIALFIPALLVTQGLFISSGRAQEKDPLGCRSLVCYTIKEGDTLSGISEQFGVSLGRLVKVNKLKNTLIRPGEVLLIPDRAAGLVPETISRSNISRDDLMLLARIIYAEARGESFTGQVAVGAVILNRVASPYFPKTIREVILQSNPSVHQFTPVADGSISLEPDEIAVNAALQALLGKDPTNGALFFYNPHTATDQWIRQLPVIARIGNHVFAAKA